MLLKNAAKTLPINKSTKVAILGEFAKTPRYQGAGSSLINPTQMDNLVDEVIKIAGKDAVSFAAGYTISGSDPDEQLIQEAVELARTAETAVVCVGLPDKFEVEGLDREHMALPKSHDRLVAAVAEVNPNVVVVLSNGSPVEMPWVDQVSAILEGHLGGQAGAGGLADVLYGRGLPKRKAGRNLPDQIGRYALLQQLPRRPEHG